MKERRGERENEREREGKSEKSEREAVGIGFCTMTRNEKNSVVIVFLLFSPSHIVVFLSLRELGVLRST